MLPKKHPKQKLEITAPLIRHAVESLETPLNNTLNSEATTSSESTVKANHRGDEIGSGSIARDAVEIGTDEGNMTTSDRDEIGISTSLAHLGVSHADNVDPESLARLGLFYIDTEDTDDEEVTNIAQWNCHEVSNGHFTSSKSHLKDEVYEMFMCSAEKSMKSKAENSQTLADVGSDYCTNLECKHKRCCDYLDCDWEPLEYCDGRPIDKEEYEEWYNGFERV